VAVVLLLYNDSLGNFFPQEIGTILIKLAAILTLVSMGYYLKAAYDSNTQSRTGGGS